MTDQRIPWNPDHVSHEGNPLHDPGPDPERVETSTGVELEQESEARPGSEGE